MSLKNQTQLGHYKIISSLGAGGMGQVFLAEDGKQLALSRGTINNDVVLISNFK